MWHKIASKVVPLTYVYVYIYIYIYIFFFLGAESLQVDWNLSQGLRLIADPKKDRVLKPIVIIKQLTQLKP